MKALVQNHYAIGSVLLRGVKRQSDPDYYGRCQNFFRGLVAAGLRAGESRGPRDMNNSHDVGRKGRRPLPISEDVLRQRAPVLAIGLFT